MKGDSIVYTKNDKGLGMYAVVLRTYIHMCLKNLTNKNKFYVISEEQAWAEIKQLQQDIFQWTLDIRGYIDDKVVECIRAFMDKSTKDPFAYLYVMPKIHNKGPIVSKPRGVSSDCGSLPHTLWKWVEKTTTNSKEPCLICYQLSGIEGEIWKTNTETKQLTVYLHHNWDVPKHTHRQLLWKVGKVV